MTQFNSFLFKSTGNIAYGMSDYAQGHKGNRKWKPFPTCLFLYITINWFRIPLCPDPNYCKGKCLCPSEASNTKRWKHITTHLKSERKGTLVACLASRYNSMKGNGSCFWQYHPHLTSSLLIQSGKIKTQSYKVNLKNLKTCILCSSVTCTLSFPQ